MQITDHILGEHVITAQARITIDHFALNIAIAPNPQHSTNKIMQNEPNLRRFSPKNNDSTQKRTQNEPNLPKKLDDVSYGEKS